VEAHTKTVVYQVKVSRGSSTIAVAQPSSCPAIAGDEVAAIESSQLPVRAKSGVRATGMTSAHGHSQAASGVTADDHFAAEIHL